MNRLSNTGAKLRVQMRTEIKELYQISLCRVAAASRFGCDSIIGPWLGYLSEAALGQGLQIHLGGGLEPDQ